MTPPDAAPAEAPPPADVPTVLPDVADALPDRMRLAPGLTTLWRSAACLQFGVNPDRAMVLDDLSEPLTALLHRLDGSRRTTDLLTEAEAAGAAPGEARAVLAELHGAGLAPDAAPVDGGPSGWHRIALATEAARWSVHTIQSPRDLLLRRREAAVRVIGSGRVAVALATSLAAGGVGQVTVHTTGTVVAEDLGTGLLADDLGRPRSEAMLDAIRRAAPAVQRAEVLAPDLTVLTDTVAPDPALVSELTMARMPHLVGYADEGHVTVGPLVWPGRTGCLRCAELHHADADAAWPKLAAQLAGTVAATGLSATLLAAALTAEQTFALLAGPEAGRPPPAAWGATLELDPIRGTLQRRHRPPHPRCTCGAR